MAYEPIVVVDCSAPRGEQVTFVPLSRDEIDARDAQRAAAEAREQARVDAEQAEADQLVADAAGLPDADEAETKAILARMLQRQLQTRTVDTRTAGQGQR